MASETRRLLVLIVVGGALLRFVPVWFGLPYPQARPDEEVAIGRALRALEGHLNPQFFHWPSLTFYVFAAVLGAASGLRELLGFPGEMTFSGQALVTRGTIALCGTLTIVVLFRVGRRIAGDTIGVLTAAFLAVALLHVRESHFAMTDALMTLLVWTSLAFLVSTALADVDGDQPSRRAAILCAYAGLASGLAMSTKYNAAAVGVAMAALQIVWVWRRPSAVLSWRMWVPSLTFGLMMMVGFLVATPYAVLDYPKFIEDLRFDFTHLSDGHNDIDLGPGWIYHATRSLPYGAGLATCVAALLGIAPFVRRHGRAAIVTGSFAVALYLALGRGYTVFFRYVLPLIPFVCLLAAFGVDALAKWVARHRRVTFGRVLPLVALLAVGPGLVSSVWFDLLLARTDTRVLAGDWLVRRLQPGATLHDAGGRYTRLDLWRVPVVRPDYDPDRNVFAEGQLPEWLVLQSSVLPVYASTPPALAQLARERYLQVYRVEGRRPGGRVGVYDWQDAFFLPFSGFQDVLRPGPTITIFRRADLPPLVADDR